MYENYQVITLHRVQVWVEKFRSSAYLDHRKKNFRGFIYKK